MAKKSVEMGHYGASELMRNKNLQKKLWITVKASKKKNEERVFTNLCSDLIYLKPEKPKFVVGDKVRILKYKRPVFDKGYTPNWTEEIFRGWWSFANKTCYL